MTEKITVGSIEMTWDSSSRLAFIQFSKEIAATGRDATALVEALSRWVGSEEKLFGLLGDGARLSNVDAEYRFVWGRFFRQHRDHSLIAFFNMSPFIRIAAEMFSLGLGLRLKAFAREDEARSWLRDMGISA